MQSRYLQEFCNPQKAQLNLQTCSFRAMETVSSWQPEEPSSNRRQKCSTTVAESSSDRQA